MDLMLSGIKPTGKVTLGNYLGAIRNFVNYQNEYEMMVFVANLHALTIDNNPAELRKNTIDLVALYLACGLDPSKATIFVQSEVLEHATLGFILTCQTYMGELNRMTQYKDKLKKESNIGAGIFTYPTLMAADILLYNPKFVPVGDDQKQHVELTRDIAERFNHKFGDTFIVPTPVVAKIGSRIMSLSDPSKKMSKSDESGDKGCIYLLEDPNLAKKKIMSAVTDNDTLIKYDETNKPGISNLMEIYSCLTSMSINDIEEKFKDSNYATFKNEVGEVVKNKLIEIQTKYNQVINDGTVEKVLEEGRQKASYIAMKTLRKVYKRVGFNFKKD